MIYSSLHGSSEKCLYVLTWFMIIFSCATFAFCQATGNVEIRGKILDPQLKPVADARVSVISGRDTTACRFDPDASFVCQVFPDKSFTIEIMARGFAIYKSNQYTVKDWPRDAEFRLAVAEIRDRVIVTAARTATRIGD